MNYKYMPDGELLQVMAACRKRAKKNVDSKIRKLKRNTSHITFDDGITVEFLKGLYTNQKGVCAVTGFELDMKRMPNGIVSPFKISIDRIDSSKGYEIGNIRFVCLAVNLMLNQWTDEEIAPFIKIKEAA